MADRRRKVAARSALPNHVIGHRVQHLRLCPRARLGRPGLCRFVANPGGEAVERQGGRGRGSGQGRLLRLPAAERG